jgi:hypothetical protein
MYMMLGDCGYTADRANTTQKQALAAANYACSLSVGMKKLLAELQKDLKRPHSQPTSDRSQTRLELVMVLPMVSEDEHWMLSQIGDGSRQIKPSATPGQTQEGVLSKALQCNLDITCQCLGLLYEANADPAAISEVVAQAREACMILEHHKCLDQAGFNGVQPPQERSNQWSGHNHLLGTTNIPRQSVHSHALLPTLLVNIAMPEQALPPSTPHQILQFNEATHPTPA